MQHGKAFDKLGEASLGAVLLFSVQNSNMEILQIILNSRLVDKISTGSFSKAIIQVARYKQTEVLNLLHSKQKIVELTIALLKTAAETGDLQTLCDLLIATKSDQRFNWQGAISAAIAANQTPAFKVIIGAVLQNLNKLPNRTIMDKTYWQRAFSYAALHNLGDGIKLLLDNAREQVTPWITGGLQVAIDNNHTKLVELLVDNQMQNERRNYGRALEMAVTVSNPRAVKLLLSSEEKYNNTIDLDKYRLALRAMLSHNNQAEVLRLLLADRKSDQLDARDLEQIYNASTAQHDYKRLALLVNHSYKLQNNTWLGFVHERMVVAILCAGYELPVAIVKQHVGTDSLSSFNKAVHNIAREAMRSGEDNIITLIRKALATLEDDGSIAVIADKINYLISVARKLEEEGIPVDISLDVLSPLVEYYTPNNQAQRANTASNAGVTSRSQSSVGR